MIRCLLLACSFFWILPAWIVLPVSAQENEEARRAAIRATEAVMMKPDASFEAFIEESLAPSFRASMTEEELVEHLTACRQAVAGAGGLDVAIENDEIHLQFSEGAEATVVLRLNEAGQIAHLALKADPPAESGSPEQMVQEAMQKRVRALESLGSVSDDQALLAFIDEHFTEAYRRAQGEAALLERLRSLRAVIAEAGGIQVSAGAEETVVGFRGPTSVDLRFSLEAEPPYRIAKLFIDRQVEEAPREMQMAPITWENLEERLAEEEEEGFAGTVLMVRDGQVVLHRGYGEADRERDRPNTTETVYDIGSTPIDFTRAAILKLVDDGRLRLSDPIDRYIETTPPDKRGLTIEHLLSGRSGLPNYHHRPEVDADYDLTWIDRDEAIRRILAQPLLFAPGSGEAHSHSAYVLLAAIVEIVTGDTYAAYLQTAFFDPIGMTRTGFYGDSARFSDEDMAVGYGTQQVGALNNPRHWGPASWLVMGSGGMVSTPGDMHKWLKALFSGDYLSSEAITRYRLGQVLAGGSDRGFLMMYRDDPNQTAIISSNAHQEQGDRASTVARALMRIVHPEF